jgi:hypothetical protein
VRDARVLPLTRIDRSLGTFDTILVLRNNFGLAGPRRAAAVLRRLARVARPGALLVTDSVDPRRLDHQEVGADGSAAPRIRVRWRDRATPWFSYLMLPPELMEEAAREGGWRVRRLIVDESPRYAVLLEPASTA